MKNNSVYEKILKLLSKKDYSEEELKEKFPDLPSSIINKLRQEKLIDDEKLAGRIVEYLQRKGKGYYYILRELERRKIKNQVIEDIKKNYDFEKEIERCGEVFQKLKDKKKKSIILNLKARGFPDEIIEKVMENFFEKEKGV